jgi:hypothetical protein
VVVACSQAKPVSYYLGHAQDRAAKIDACLVQGRDDADCRNAKQAEYRSAGIPAVNGRAAEPASR